MTDQTLTDVLNGATSLETGLRFAVPPNWTQGRTAYGGFTASLLLGAAKSVSDELPPLRSALINFTAPISEPPVISAEILRRGRNVTTVATTARIDGNVAATGTFSFGRAQDSHVAAPFPAPDAPAPEDTPDYAPPGVRLPVAFFDNFEVRLIDGTLPFAGADRGYVRMWARHRDPAIWGRIEGLVAIADLPPPAVFTMLTRPGPNSSVNWIVNLLDEAPATRDGWWMIESAMTAGHDGYSSQVMRVWNSDRVLVIDGMQSVLIFV
jgi:acyl-CoA thioesterase